MWYVLVAVVALVVGVLVTAAGSNSRIQAFRDDFKDQLAKATKRRFGLAEAQKAGGYVTNADQARAVLGTLAALGFENTVALDVQNASVKTGAANDQLADDNKCDLDQINALQGDIRSRRAQIDANNTKIAGYNGLATLFAA